MKDIRREMEKGRKRLEERVRKGENLGVERKEEREEEMESEDGGNRRDSVEERNAERE